MRLLLRLISCAAHWVDAWVEQRDTTQTRSCQTEHTHLRSSLQLALILVVLIAVAPAKRRPTNGVLYPQAGAGRGILDCARALHVGLRSLVTVAAAAVAAAVRCVRRRWRTAFVFDMLDDVRCFAAITNGFDRRWVEYGMNGRRIRRPLVGGARTGCRQMGGSSSINGGRRCRRGRRRCGRRKLGWCGVGDEMVRLDGGWIADGRWGRWCGLAATGARNVDGSVGSAWTRGVGAVEGCGVWV